MLARSARLHIFDRPEAASIEQGPIAMHAAQGFSFYARRV
jgi:hypothetical protein